MLQTSRVIESNFRLQATAGEDRPSSAPAAVEPRS